MWGELLADNQMFGGRSGTCNSQQPTLQVLNYQANVTKPRGETWTVMRIP
jgi:predicted RNA-binding protein associated with RNAse of E/G family